MLKLETFLVCLCAILLVFSMTACIELYALERAMARGVFTDIIDDMQDIGYLEPAVATYYREKMDSLGWQGADGDYFRGTSPQSEAIRAHKERGEVVSLTLRIRPSRLSQWLHLFATGEPLFQFHAVHSSEYFAEGW